MQPLTQRRCVSRECVREPALHPRVRETLLNAIDRGEIRKVCQTSSHVCMHELDHDELIHHLCKKDEASCDASKLELGCYRVTRAHSLGPFV